jgi:hypothetical protein
MSAVVKHSSLLLFAEVASPFLSSFFSRQEHTRATHSSYPSVYGVRCFSCHQRARILLFRQAYRSSPAVGSWLPIRGSNNFEILILLKKVIPVFLSVVDPDSAADEKDTTIHCRMALLWIKVKLKYQIFQCVYTVKTRWSWTLCYSGVVQIARNLVHIVA